MPHPTPAGPRPARITMVGCSAPSHIHPGLAVIRELVDRGHHVRYAVGEPFADMVAATGAEPIAHPTLLPAPGGPRDTWPEDLMAAMTIFLDEGIAVLPHLLDAHADAPPDLVLYDIGGLAGPPAAARWGVPAVQLSPAMVAWEGYEEDMAEVMDPLWASPGGVDYRRRHTAWLRESGVTRSSPDVLGRPEHCVALIPRPLQPNAERVRDDIAFVGPCLDPARLSEGGWDPPADDRPLLYVGFGTAYTDRADIYRACIEAFADTGWRVLIAVGRQVSADDLGPLPEGVEIRPYVPQLAVLAHASAFVTHAGMGGCAEGLWFGVPMVAVPQAVDQFANADRLAELGVGRHLPSDEVTPERLRDAVLGLVGDPEVAARCATLREQVRAGGGAARAADIIEAHLDRPPAGWRS